MKLHNCELHYPRTVDKKEFYFFTANAFVRKDGALAMGKGAAKSVLHQHPGIDQRFGRLITAVRDEDSSKPEFATYLLIWLNDYRIGAFQVKYDFQRMAYPDLIEQSARRLKWYAEAWPDVTIRMNYPGVGLKTGGLPFEMVEHILDEVELPDNVHLYYKP